MRPVVAILLARFSQTNVQSVKGTFNGSVVPYRRSRMPLRRDFRYSRFRQNDRLVPFYRIRHDITRLADHLRDYSIYLCDIIRRSCTTYFNKGKNLLTVN